MMAEGDPEENLQEWMDRLGLRQNENLWALKAGTNQMIWVRDTLSNLAATGLGYEGYKALPKVVNTHMSKSVILPVYKLARPDFGIELFLRGNFHDWKLSVRSKNPIVVDLSGLCPIKSSGPDDRSLSGSFFEGFLPELVFPYYEDSDKRQWSASLFNNERLFTTVFLVLRTVGVIKPW